MRWTLCKNQTVVNILSFITDVNNKIKKFYRILKVVENEINVILRKKVQVLEYIEQLRSTSVNIKNKLRSELEISKTEQMLFDCTAYQFHTNARIDKIANILLDQQRYVHDLEEQLIEIYRKKRQYELLLEKWTAEK